jgi:SAM-dependent methyltransferase
LQHPKMIREPEKGEPRTPSQIAEAYEIEKDLADKLRNSTKDQRRLLYSSLYDEFYRRVPLTPQLARKASGEEKKRQVSHQMEFLGRYLREDSVFMEVGPGDCALSLDVAKRVKKVYAIDVSEEISRLGYTPENFQLILSDGSNIPLDKNSVTVAFSSHLMEHLHPDDAIDQLRNIYNTLAPGGTYICVTPNRLAGPHDISKYFDRTATGFHLKEYTFTELQNMFRETGFLRVKAFTRMRGYYFCIPSLLIILCEKALSISPYPVRTALSRRLPFRFLLNVYLVGMK